MLKNSIYGSYFWVLGIGVLLALLFVIQAEVSRAKSNDSKVMKPIEIERVPAKEAKSLGIQ